MPAQLGCDPRALDDLANRYQAVADRLGLIDERITRTVQSLAWNGPDQARFRNDIDRVRASIETCSQRCERAASRLRLDAAQQRSASEAVHGMLLTSGVASWTERWPERPAQGWNDDPTHGGGLTGASTWTSKRPDPDRASGGSHDLDSYGLVALAPAQLAGAIEQIDASSEMVAESRARHGTLGRLGDWTRDLNPNSRSDGEILGDLKAERAAVSDMIDENRQILSLRAGDRAGDFRVVEVLGDLATATTVVVAVPGMGTGPAQFDGNGHKDARSLRAEIERRGLGESIAVVSWADYEIPQTLPNAARSEFAEEGGKRLASFVRRLHEAGFDPDSITVVGHSYGSVVVGYAMEAGLDAKHAVAVGSPGMGGANTRADLGSEGTELWVGEAAWDIVADTAAHGADPGDAEFGARSLRTGDSTGHSDYFRPGSQSLAAIVDIAES